MKFKTMNKDEQIKQQQKEIEAKTLSEKLLQLSEQHSSLQEKIKPLGKVLENITDTQKAFQVKSPFAELAKNPLLENITASTTIFQNSPIMEFAKQQRQLYESLQDSHWTETILGLNNIFPKIGLPKWDFPTLKPLYEYGLNLQKIQTAFTTPEIVKSFQSMKDLANEFEESKTKVENEFYYKITVEDYEFEETKDKEKITALEAENEKEKAEKEELRQRVLELEIAVRNMFRLSLQPQAKAKQSPARTLRPNITVSQIARLCEEMKGVFEATAEQWRALFSETEIQLAEPIKAKTTTDIGILLFYLKEKNLIETKNYPSILERVKAFSIGGEIVTSKQISDTKQQENFPIAGKYYSKIEKAVTTL